MSLKERLSGIWLITMTLLSLFAFTVYYVAQMWLSLLQALYLTLAVLQITTLIFYLWGPEKIRSGGIRLLYHILYVSSFFVIPCFLFIFMGLVSQYHVRLPDSLDASSIPIEQILPEEKTVVYDTGTVYVIFPSYTEIDLMCQTRPSKSDGAITWCSGAAFQHDIRFGFTHENIDGDHAVKGTFYESPYNKDSFAAFVFTDGHFSFAFENPSEAIREAAAAGGCGFMQFGLIREGETVMTVSRPRARCYRALVELNGNLGIIDSINMMHFDDFMTELHRLGVTNALYMDMGAGWNYSWFRNAYDHVVTLFGLPVPWSHNWLVFRDQKISS